MPFRRTIYDYGSKRKPPMTTTSMSPFKKILFSFMPLVAIGFVLELGSFLFFSSHDQLHGNLAFHPLFHSHGYQSLTFNDTRYQYDPFLAYRYAPNKNYGPLQINELGFI